MSAKVEYEAVECEARTMVPEPVFVPILSTWEPEPQISLNGTSDAIEVTAPLELGKAYLDTLNDVFPFSACDITGIDPVVAKKTLHDALQQAKPTTDSVFDKINDHRLNGHQLGDHQPNGHSPPPNSSLARLYTPDGITEAYIEAWSKLKYNHNYDMDLQNRAQSWNELTHLNRSQLSPLLLDLRLHPALGQVYHGGLELCDVTEGNLVELGYFFRGLGFSQALKIPCQNKQWMIKKAIYFPI